jgi:putative ABC transport system permease protein
MYKCDECGTKRNQTLENQTADMIKNYFKFAWRNLAKNKVSSFINIGGLTIGIAVALLIGLWLYDELSFNKYHQDYEHIAQIMVGGNDAKNGPYINNSIQYPLATEMLTNYKNNFSHVVRAGWAGSYILSVGEKKISVSGQFMDADAPAMLTLKMLKGNWDGLKDPYSIMLSASVAKAFFADADPINQVVTLNNKTTVKVTGVYEDLPQNTQFKDNKFFSTWKLWELQNDWIQQRATNDWHNHFIRLYASIKHGTDFTTASNNIKNAELQNIKGIDDYKEEAASNPQVFLHPMSSWHLYPYKKGITDDKPVNMVWMVGIIGMFVLLLACINFMNLSTARSEKRAKEVGIRKTIGSMRKQLVYQFLSESFLVVIISFVFACLIVIASLPWFNNLAAKEMVMPWNDVYFWLISLGFIFFTGLLAGSYPAFYLSSFKPVKVLKGSFRVGRLAAIPRKALVVTQFTVSVALIICTITVFRQLKFAKDRPVGYTREGLITIPMKSADFYGRYDVFRKELLNTGVVNEFSESMGKPTEVASGNNGFEWRGKDPNKDESFGTLAVTHEHGKTMGWQFIAGRDFSKSLATDSAAVVINEAAAKYMGLKNPVGENLTWNWFWTKTSQSYTIIGVIKDVIMESPYEPVGPAMFFIKALNGGVSCMNIRINPGVAMDQALPKIEAIYKKLIPSAPFDYKFVDQDYAMKFAAEERISKLAGFFAVLAVFISCLGLFGLASFVAEQRTKEIGVRKILGATLFDLWQLLSKEFAALVIISLFIAAPLAWYFMHSWLQNYQYRAELSWWIFAAAGAGALVITLLTVSYQAIKTALANPVKSLRTE